MTEAAYHYPELPPCLECGACCVTDLEYGKGGFVRLQAGDFDRLPEKYRLKVIKDSDPGVDRLGHKGLPTTGYRCVALRGEVNKKVSCAIYEERPTLCRTFERGSQDCRKEYARWKFGRYQR
jgi:Fe-S-cluster containining protein